MELNREQIIKALECCISGDDCTMCPLCEVQSCPCVLNEDSLALIKELTQANEQLSESYDHLEKTKDEVLSERARLVWENERLMKERIALGDIVSIARDQAKADTVRKMQDMVTMHFGTYTQNDTVKILDVFKMLDQIAKEMEEEI